MFSAASVRNRAQITSVSWQVIAVIVLFAMSWHEQNVEGKTGVIDLEMQYQAAAS